MKRYAYGLVLVLLSLLFSGCAGTPKPEKTAEQLYAEGEAAFGRSSYERSIELWKQVRESFPGPELASKAEIGIANAYFLNGDYIEAAAAYEDFRKLHPTHELAQFALYRQALASYNLITGIDTDQTPTKNALALFESFVRQYPKSEYVAKVQEKIADCRGKLAQYEIYVGRFYYRTDNYKAAAARFELVLVNFPDYTGHDETLLYLGKSYRELKERERMRTILSRLVREYPASPHLGEARKLLAEKP
ncbi:outer membrane protein assembly factor BamD [Trichlorobacter ammonificans]|uniref:Outer membrane protein assembly factor BamD n=1 Tax=Trichlorobacter ammonificans TaxID=2916410 RepID=A0ABM9DB11_9BACT|nr:outer membrane protein assembly factor BamD [Trichlorobacter ammonificans]CAH2032387.1 Outer membrane protein assembly factor BamD [Trichlorobacter ammonificans]